MASLSAESIGSHPTPRGCSIFATGIFMPLTKPLHNVYYNRNMDYLYGIKVTTGGKAHVMRFRAVASVGIIAVFVLLGCEGHNKALIGGAGGGAAGGLMGAKLSRGNPELTIGGALLGALAGGAIGSRMDAADRRAIQQTTYSAVNHQPIGYPVRWRNNRSGNYGQVVTTREIQDQYGRYCREYQQTVTVGGKTQDAHGTACLQPDGSWRVQ